MLYITNIFKITTEEVRNTYIKYNPINIDFRINHVTNKNLVLHIEKSFSNSNMTCFEFAITAASLINDKTAKVCVIWGGHYMVHIGELSDNNSIIVDPWASKLDLSNC